MAEGVALRKESVDRNISLIYQQAKVCPSLSARRAWIEMYELASYSWR